MSAVDAPHRARGALLRALRQSVHPPGELSGRVSELVGNEPGARRALKEHLEATPLIQLDRARAANGAAILLKAESLQPGGSFKIRGALHVIGGLDEDHRKRGVIAYSTGNHARAVAMAAVRYATRATIVMSPDAPTSKVEAVRSAGASIVMAEPTSQARRTLAEQLAHARKLLLVPPYDHPGVITAQGTIALELLDQCPEAAAVLVPIGGGGLIAGVATAIKQLNPAIKVIGVEPELENDAAQSFHGGRRVALPAASASMADAIKVQTLGDLTFPIIQRYVDDVATASEYPETRALTSFTYCRI